MNYPDTIPRRTDWNQLWGESLGYVESLREQASELQVLSDVARAILSTWLFACNLTAFLCILFTILMHASTYQHSSNEVAAALANKWQEMQPFNYFFWPAMEISSPLVTTDAGLSAPLPIGALRRVSTWSGMTPILTSLLLLTLTCMLYSTSKTHFERRRSFLRPIPTSTINSSPQH